MATYLGKFWEIRLLYIPIFGHTAKTTFDAYLGKPIKIGVEL